METMVSKLRQKGTTLASDASSEVRLQTRPKQSQSGGTDFADLGNDFTAKRSSQTRSGSQNTRRSPPNSQPKPRPKPKLGISAMPLEELDIISSDDELDFIPRSSSQSVTCSPSATRAMKQTKAPVKIDNEIAKGEVVDGVFHEYHDNYKPKKLPNFKKIKKITDGETPPASQPKPPPAPSRPQASGSKTHISLSPSPPPPPPPKATSSRPIPRRRQVAVNDDGDDDDEHSPTRPTTRTCVRRDKAKVNQAPLHELSSNGSRPSSQITLRDDDDIMKTPRPSATTSQRPRPRPAYRSAQAAKPAAFPEQSPLVADRGKGKDKGKEAMAATGQDFPAPESPGKGKASLGKAKGKAKATESINPIAHLSPLSNKVSTLSRTSSKASVAAFPDISPLSSPAGREKLQRNRAKAQGSSQAKRARAVIISESDTTDEEVPMLAPFPMETQMLESIGQSPNGKRASEEDSEEESDTGTRRQRKKRREDPHEILAKLLHSDDMSDFDEEDLLFLDPNVDPATLCPWCDERLPPVPTPHLTSLMDHARRVSTPDARPTNPLGLRAPLGAFVGVCQRHRFESHQVPHAQQMGWPVEIDWERVGPRVEALRDQLEEIVRDVDEEFLPGAHRRDEDEEDEDRYAGCPRKGSIFWRDVVKSVRKTGSRQTAGVRGQFASFSKTQPGYYGELGYVIIHQTIYNLFPLTSFDSDATLPLTPTDFVQLILVPEAAVALIMEDLGQDRATAINTLRDSAEYGVAMFPDDHTDGAAAVAAGDQIVMERAKARRKELEEEERLEDALWGSLEGAPLPLEGSRGSRKSSRVASRAKTESETSEAEQSSTARGKRKTRAPGKPPVIRADEDDVIMLTDSASSGTDTRSGKARGGAERSRPKPRKKTHSVAASSSMDVGLSEGANHGQPRPVRPRPRQIGRGLEASQNASQGPVKEKENARKNDGTDTDVQEHSPPPSTQPVVPYVRWDDKGTAHFSSPRESSDLEATPRPKLTSRTSSMSSTTATVGLERKALLPLQVARERASGKTRAATQDDKWTYSLREQRAQSTDIEDDAGSVADVPTSSNPANQRSSRQATKQDKESYSWLLSEGSTPTSSQ
ncbi:RTC4-like domain-containing protein [Amylocystis lapponica]|nr:RTC4-like domain-containing protein [Amylocystis lapponica]